MMVLAAVTVVLLVVAVVLFVVMFRRNDSMLGLVALVVALGAASTAVLYGGMDSL